MDAPSIDDPSTDARSTDAPTNAPSTHAPSTDTPSPLALLAILEARPLDATLPEGTPTHALARFFGLSDPQAEALALLTHPVFTTLVAHCTRPEPRAHVVAAALDLAPHELDALFAPYARLRTTGLVDEALRPTELVRHCLQSAVSAEDLDAWVREEPSGHCTLGDFSYGGPRVEVLARQLALAARERRAMWVGARAAADGSFDELLRAIATEAGATLVRLREPCPLMPDSVPTLRLAQLAARRAMGPMIFVVERERSPLAGPTKVDRDFPGPVVLPLAEEKPEGEEPAVDFVVTLPAMPVATREHALRRAFGGDDAEPWIDAAARTAMPFDQLARLAKAVRGPRRAHDLLLLVEGSQPSLPSDSVATDALAYEPTLCRTDVSVERLLAMMSRTTRGAMLFHGPPGTGKSAFARHLAARGGLTLTSLAASDLLERYVGQSEQRIAKAFRDARERRALLLVDEADSFLLDRRGLEQSWELSLVNEMLVNLERHDGWVICTTNLLDRLDPAVRRRLPITVRFDPPDRDARRALFRSACDALALPHDDAACAAVDAAEGVTPGDAAAIVQSARALGDVETAAELAARFLRHAAPRRRAVGFG